MLVHVPYFINLDHFFLYLSNLFSPNVALKQHSNFLASTPTAAYEQRSHFVYLISVKNFCSADYSKLKFRCEKSYMCFKISFRMFKNWWQMSFQVCLLFSFLIFMIMKKCVFYEEVIQESGFINWLRCLRCLLLWSNSEHMGHEFWLNCLKIIDLQGLFYNIL